MTATPDIAAPTVSNGPSDVARDLGLYGVAVTLVIAAVVGAGRYGWLLIHLQRLDPIDQNLEPGWQVTIAKVAIGCVILAAGLFGGYSARRLGRALHERTPHTRAVRFASLLPGILLGALVIHAINPALSWASGHTASAAADRVEDRRFAADAQKRLAEERKAPLRFQVVQPAASAAAAQRLVSPASLGAGWYSLQTPAASVFPRSPELEAQGATTIVTTDFAKANRTSTGWQLNVYVGERWTGFRSTSEAARYAGNYPQTSSQPCHCGLTVPATTISQISTTTEHGIVLHTWTETTQQISDPEASFNVGPRAYTMLLSGFHGAPVSKPQFDALLRAAVLAARTAD